MMAGMSFFNDPPKGEDNTAEAGGGQVEAEVVDEPTPEPEPEAPKPKPKRKSRKNVYVLEAGDTPSIVSRKLYGKASRGPEIWHLNQDVRWKPGSEITLPEGQ